MTKTPPELGTVSVAGWDDPPDDSPAWVQLRHERYPGLLVRVTFSDTGALAGVAFDRAPDGPPITRNAVKAVPLGELERVARGFLRWWRDDREAGRSSGVKAREAELRRYNAAMTSIGHSNLIVDPYSGSRVSRRRDAFAAYDRRKAPPRRHLRDERWYAELAQQYVVLCDDGVKAPIRELAKRRSYEESTLRNAISKARRELGLLTETARGQRGGELTPKAMEILEQGD